VTTTQPLPLFKEALSFTHSANQWIINSRFFLLLYTFKQRLFLLVARLILYNLKSAFANLGDQFQRRRAWFNIKLFPQAGAAYFKLQ